MGAGAVVTGVCVCVGGGGHWKRIKLKLSEWLLYDICDMRQVSVKNITRSSEQSERVRNCISD